MTTETASVLQGATLVDFTGKLDGFKHMSGFGDEFVRLVRSGSPPRSLVIVDRGVWMKEAQPLTVKDHLNLTGSNPLIGPNHPAGERFPVVQGVYVTDCLPALGQGIAAGLKAGLVPTGDDIALLRSLGADCCCYNLVPSMLIAAHAGLKVLGIVVGEGDTLSAEILKEIAKLTGGK